MTDVRQSLNHGTFTNVYTKAWSLGGTLYPRTTFTHPTLVRYVYNDIHQVYELKSQDPIVEGELIIYFKEEFGITVAEPFVGILINGALVWKEVHLYNSTELPS